MSGESCFENVVYKTATADCIVKEASSDSMWLQYYLQVSQMTRLRFKYLHSKIKNSQMQNLLFNSDSETGHVSSLVSCIHSHVYHPQDVVVSIAMESQCTLISLLVFKLGLSNSHVYKQCT